MADNNEANDKQSLRNITSRLENIDNEMKSLYQTTYKTRIDNKADMDRIVGTIDDNIDNLLSKINSRSTSDISNLYVRLQRKGGGTVDQLNSTVEDLFNDSNILSAVNFDSLSKSIKAEDYQYDLICKFMPKLEDALEIKKDNVLSSDNFTKDFINAVSDKSSKEYLRLFNDNATNVIEKYNFQDLAEEIYEETSRYGEYFLYHVPYKKAFERLNKRKQQFGATSSGVAPSFSNMYESSIIFEAAQAPSIDIDGERLDPTFMNEMDNNTSVQLTFNCDSMINSVVEYVAVRERVKNSVTSLTEEYYLTEADENTNTGDLKAAKGFDELIAPDGFSGTNGSKLNNKDKIKEINGSVLAKLERANTFPICISDEYTIGYINIEVQNDFVSELMLNGQTYNSLTNRTSLGAEEFDRQNDMLIANIASIMSSQIDSKFINANVDLKEEIYAILRYNDKFCATKGNNNIIVSFLPVEDVHHIYFKKDKKSHRGISDLKRATIPAMLYCVLYLTDIIGKISRSQDKRIYYVKQNVETNVARTLLNVVNQIKRGNMGMRQLENMNSIFNVIGKYNDHVIPLGPSGDAPIQFEVMEGQKSETPTELMDRMEEMAVTSTDVPIEFIQSVNQVDYATRFTMSNSKFLRKVFKRQRVFQGHLTNIFRKLYNFEFCENEQNVKILLPAPAFLTMTNSSQLIENNKNYASAIAEIVCVGEEQEVKDEFVLLYIRKNLGTYIDFDTVDDMIIEAKHTIEYKKVANADVSADYGGEEEY